MFTHKMPNLVLLLSAAVALFAFTCDSIPVEVADGPFQFTATREQRQRLSHKKKPNGAVPKDKITVAAYVYDPWTPDDVVFGEHGPNFTEWSLVSHALPRFAGHQQPHIPLWGEIDTSLPATWDTYLNPAAVEHGVTVYLYDWYWWQDAPSNPLLVRGLEEGYLKSATKDSVKFAVMWANQDWTDLMPAKRKDPSPVRFNATVDVPTWTTLSQYWIDRYFPDSAYYRAPNITDPTGPSCPLVSIYLVSELVSGFGGVARTAAAFADFRRRAAQAGFPCVHIQAIGFGVRSLPEPLPTTLETLGINSVSDYCWQHYEGMDGFPLADYAGYSSKAISRYPDLAAQVEPIPYIPNFSVAWDPSPRTVQTDAFDNWGYPATAVLQPTVDEILTALNSTATYVADACDALWCMITVYAYTEFSEGGSLFPTVADGNGRLQAFQSVFGNRSTAL